MGDVQIVREWDSVRNAFVTKAEDSGGSGFDPVCVYLQQIAPIDINGSGAHLIKWDRALDDPWSFNTLTSLPAGLGITTAIDGTDGSLTTTEAGVWAFTLLMGLPADATWAGLLTLDDNTQARQQSVPATVGSSFVVQETIKYPAGAVLIPQVGTQTPATATPYNANPSLVIVRLA